MASPVSSGANINPLTSPTGPIGDNPMDIFEQMLILANQQCVGGIVGTNVIPDGANFSIGSVSGTIFGNASSKIGFFGAAAVVQQTAATELNTALFNLGLTTTASTTRPINTAAINIADGSNVSIGSVSGTTFGNASSKIGFFSSAVGAGVVQQGPTIELNTVLGNLGLTTTASTTRPINTAAITVADGSNMNIGSVSGTTFGNASSKLGFFNSAVAAAVAFQNVSSNAAVVTTAVTSATPYGFSTAAQATSIITLVNAIRTALTNYNL